MNSHIGLHARVHDYEASTQQRALSLLRPASANEEAGELDAFEASAATEVECDVVDDSDGDSVKAESTPPKTRQRGLTWARRFSSSSSVEADRKETAHTDQDRSSPRRLGVGNGPADVRERKGEQEDNSARVEDVGGGGRRGEESGGDGRTPSTEWVPCPFSP